MTKFAESLADYAKDLVALAAVNFPAIALAFALTAWLLLFLPAQAQELLHLSSFVTGYAQWIGLTALIATTVLLVYSAAMLAKWLSGRRRDAIVKRDRAAMLAALTPAERGVVLRFVEAQSLAIPLSLYDGVPDALVKRGILTKADSLPNAFKEQDFLIATWGYELLLQQRMPPASPGAPAGTTPP